MLISAGTIVPFAGSSVPSGFILCDGSAVSRATYATLFGIIGTTYGPGDGSTTFNVPDLRGRVVAGKDDMGGSAAGRLTSTTISPNGTTLGASGGQQTHALSTSEMPAHAHRVWSSDGGGSGSTVAGFGSSSISTACGLVPIGGTDGYYSNFNAGHAVMEDTGSSAAHNNVQPTLILNYVIATEDSGGSGISQANVLAIASLRG
jgi:microcystin-dependent protein